ncbi:MAG: hypothetical protein M1434_01160 [Chloroflexi bacterium]|nr:hypothetical protein [Chloroflexota bacterium]MCL5273340.1 hypothetical protein [Chloroflexota bacterium]
MKFQIWLLAYKSQYGMPSSDYYTQFIMVKLGDDMDFFEWVVNCDLRASASYFLAVIEINPYLILNALLLGSGGLTGNYRVT